MFNFFKKQTLQTSIWVPSGDTFIPYTGNPIINSINGISNDLGYQSEQVYTYRNFRNVNSIVEMIAFEFYTRNILFVFTSQPVSKLKLSDVNSYSKGYVLSEIYDASELQNTFSEAIKNKSFSADFLSDKFGIKFEADGIQLVPEINYMLFFKDGYLSDYQRSDGLNEAAHYFKIHAQSRYKLIEAHAKKFWGNNILNIQEEINIQCNALYNLPEVGNNPFIPFHEERDGWVNYYMILVTHYHEPVNLDKFLMVNHGRYKMDNSRMNTYLLGKFEYTFDSTGELINISSNL